MIRWVEAIEKQLGKIGEQTPLTHLTDESRTEGCDQPWINAPLLLSWTLNHPLDSHADFTGRRAFSHLQNESRCKKHSRPSTPIKLAQEVKKLMATVISSNPSDAELHLQLQQIPMVIDLSHGDGVESFEQAKSAGLLGVIHKATTGATGRDDQYAPRRTQAHDAGLLWGAYHWGTSAPAEEQVENFISWAAPDANTLVALDLEATLGNQMTLDLAKQFCQMLFERLGRRPVIYSGSTLKDDLGASADPFLAQHRLWLAQYGAPPKVQKSWEDFWLWQYTDGESGPAMCRTIPGILGDTQHRIDCNYFPGDASTLTSQWAS